MEYELNRIEAKIAGHVTDAYGSKDVPHYPYHNITHTQGVVTYSREIAAHYSLGKKETFVLVAAAWFHDIGHLYGGIEGHEERGVVVMRQYLSHVPRQLTDEIAACILATRVPSHPGSLNESIICDADTYHFGTELFRQTDALVHREIELRLGSPVVNWSSKTLSMLQRHTFFTDYCRTLLAKGKEENILWVEQQIKNPGGCAAREN